jgi:hypothetical protein
MDACCHNGYVNSPSVELVHPFPIGPDEVINEPKQRLITPSHLLPDREMSTSSTGSKRLKILKPPYAVGHGALRHVCLRRNDVPPVRDPRVNMDLG